MKNITNLEFFGDNPPVNCEYKKRLAFLDAQIKSLREYRGRSGKKRNLISRMITQSEIIFDKAQNKLEKIGA